MSIDNPTETLKKLNPHLWPPVAPVVELKGKAAKCAEKELQADCEKWLRGRGYARLTNLAPMDVKRGGCKGFFGHWFESQRNAFMPDLLIVPWPNNRPALFVELKVRNKWQPGQKEMIGIGLWKLAFNVEEFKTIVIEWEDERHDN